VRDTLRRLDTGRVLRFLVPAWCVLSLLSIGLAAADVPYVISFAIWIALLIGSVTGVACLVIAHQQRQPGT